MNLYKTKIITQRFWNNLGISMLLLSQFLSMWMQCHPIQMYQCWCERTSITWGGGIGIGGGAMLHVLSIVYLIIFAVHLLNIVLNLINGNGISGEIWLSMLKNMLIYLFLNSGMIYCMNNNCIYATLVYN